MAYIGSPGQPRPPVASPRCGRCHRSGIGSRCHPRRVDRTAFDGAAPAFAYPGAVRKSGHWISRPPDAVVGSPLISDVPLVRRVGGHATCSRARAAFRSAPGRVRGHDSKRRTSAVRVHPTWPTGSASVSALRGASTSRGRAGRHLVASRSRGMRPGSVPRLTPAPAASRRPAASCRHVACRRRGLASRGPAPPRALHGLAARPAAGRASGGAGRVWMVGRSLGAGAGTDGWRRDPGSGRDASESASRVAAAICSDSDRSGGVTDVATRGGRLTGPKAAGGAGTLIARCWVPRDAGRRGAV